MQCDGIVTTHLTVHLSHVVITAVVGFTQGVLGGTVVECVPQVFVTQSDIASLQSHIVLTILVALFGYVTVIRERRILLIGRNETHSRVLREVQVDRKNIHIYRAGECPSSHADGNGDACLYGILILFSRSLSNRRICKCVLELSPFAVN